jgi:WD40 repeat protein
MTDSRSLAMSLYQLMLTALLLALAVVATAHGQPPAQDLYGDPLPPGAIARLGTVRFRHEGIIVFAAFLPGGKSVVSVSSDGAVCTWEFPSGKALGRFQAFPANERPAGVASRVSGATVSPDGKRLTVFCSDRFLRVWDLANARHLGKVADVRAEGYDPRRYYFSIDSEHRPVYSPDGNTLLLATRVLQFVDVSTGREIGPRLGHADSVTAISFMPDGGQLRTQDGRTAHAWDAKTGKELATGIIKWPPRGARYTTTISPDGRTGALIGQFMVPAAVAGGPVGWQWQVLVFDTADGKELGAIDLGFNIAFPRQLRHLSFSPDSRILAVSEDGARQEIAFYELPGVKRLKTPGADPAVPAAPAKPGKQGGGVGGGGGFFGGFGNSAGLLFSPDGRALACPPPFQGGPGATIDIFDTTNGRKISALSPTGAGNPATPGAFSPDRRCLALANSDGTVTLYELATGQPRRTYSSKFPRPALTDDPLTGGLPGSMVGVKTTVSVAISPDSKLLALSGAGGSVHLWDVWAGKEVAIFKGHRLAVNALAFAPDGKTLASASDDTTALVWDVTRFARPALPASASQPDDLKNWWQTLGDSDAARAFIAMRNFVSAGDAAVAWIQDHIKPVSPLDRKRATELIKQLDDVQFKVRTQATSELLKIGEPLLPLLDQSLSGSLSAEADRRLNEVRGKLTALVVQGERLRAARAVEVLELIGTPKARQVLRTLAGGAPDALLTVSAQAALKR